MSQKLTGEIEPVRTLNPRVSEASSALVSQMLRRDPQQRPVSYEELLRKIDSLGRSDALVYAGETATMPLADIKPQETRLSESPTPAPSSPKQVLRKLPWWLLPVGAGAIGLVLILLAVVNLFTRQPLPVPRELVNIGKSASLFNGESLRGWKNLSGTWIPGKDDEGGRVIIGSDGVTARRLPALPGATEPPKFYQIEFGFSFQKAEAVELHFDLANYQEHRCILRMTRAGSVLGYRDGDQGPFAPGRTTRPTRPFAKNVDDVHSVKLERQPGGWIASVDGVEIGTLPLYHQFPESEFRLRVEKGPAWLENFVLEELTTK